MQKQSSNGRGHSVIGFGWKISTSGADIRLLKENGKWGTKCRKVYDLDGQGQRIPDGKGGWKNHREDTTDWNQRGNAEKWRALWAAYTNRAL